MLTWLSLMKKRLKNGQALDMIPMGMGNKDVGINGHFFDQGLRQRVYTGARIQDDQIIIIGSDFYAGGIAAIFNGVRSRSMEWIL